MPDVIELEDVSVETRGDRGPRDPSTHDRPAASDDVRSDDERLVGGLLHQVEEDDWLI